MGETYHSQWYMSTYSSTFTFSDNKTLILQLTSVFPVTCYVPVLWPELWLQCQSDDCFWGCSGVYRHEHTWVRFTIPHRCHVSVAMAMTTPHHQRRQWYWYGEMTHLMQPYRHTTIITKTCYSTHANTITTHPTKVFPLCCCHSNKSAIHKSPCFCCYWEHLTTNGAGIQLQLIHFQVSILWDSSATSTSLSSPRRSYGGHSCAYTLQCRYV